MVQRSPSSHKGENGKVVVIGGSAHQHGAPLFSALAAEASGVDLLYIFVPEIHAEVTKAASYNFQVHPFGVSPLGANRSDEFSEPETTRLIEFLATMDCAVIGPGLSRLSYSLRNIQRVLAEAPCPLVIDASALQSFTLSAIAHRNVVLTPHLGELERMGILPDDLATTAQKHGVTMFLKGETDHVVASDGRVEMISGGNAGLTHGGTGDALAGLIAGLMSQKIEVFTACVMAGKIIKQAASYLFESQGYAYTTKQVIDLIPHILHSIFYIPPS